MIGYFGDGGLATNAQFNRPNDVKVDATGNVYICDSNHTVRVVNTGDTIKAFAGNHVAGYTGDGGATTAAKMTAPDGLAIDAAHNIHQHSGK
jgi:sugar lactone lactonase YvrE